MLYTFVVVAKTFGLEEEIFHTVPGLIVERPPRVTIRNFKFFVFFFFFNHYMRITPVGP